MVNKKKKKNKKKATAIRKSRGGASNGSTFAPVAYSNLVETKAPVISMGSRSHRVRHREFVANINGSVALSSTLLALNPGYSETFPWLHTVASRYEQYRIHALSFEFVSRSPTSATGSVYLSVDYDPLENPPADEKTLSAYAGTVSDVPWKNLKLRIDPSAVHVTGARKYVATRDTWSPYSDDRVSDFGQLFVSTIGQADASGIGKLWVDYDIELFVPQIPGGGGGSSLYGHSGISRYNSVEQKLADKTTENVHWGNSMNALAGILDPFSYSYAVATGSISGLPPGAYMARWSLCLQSSTGDTVKILTSLEVNGVAKAGPFAPSEIFENFDVALHMSQIVGQEAFRVNSTTDFISITVHTDSSTGAANEMKLRAGTCRLEIQGF